MNRVAIKITIFADVPQLAPGQDDVAYARGVINDVITRSMWPRLSIVNQEFTVENADG